MQVMKKLYNSNGQMLIEVIGAVIVVSVILTAAAGSLIGNWNAMVKMTKVVPETIHLESLIHLAVLQNCQGSVEGANCLSTSFEGLKLVTLRVNNKTDSSLPMLVYAPTQ